MNKLSGLEVVILSLLSAAPKPISAGDMAKMTSGYIELGSAHVTLRRLEGKKLIKSTLMKSDRHSHERKHYSLMAAGKKNLNQWNKMLATAEKRASSTG